MAEGEAKTQAPHQEAQTPRNERGQGFTSIYANNVQVESSSWDLKLIFGQYDNQLGPNGVRQHVAVTMAWPEVKAVCNVMLVNLAFYEALNSEVKMPTGTMPPLPKLDESNPILKTVYERVKKFREVLFGEK